MPNAKINAVAITEEIYSYYGILSLAMKKSVPKFSEISSLQSPLKFAKSRDREIDKNDVGLWLNCS